MAGGLLLLIGKKEAPFLFGITTRSNQQGRAQSYLRIGRSSGFAFHPDSFASKMSGMVVRGGEAAGRFHGWTLIF